MAIDPLNYEEHRELGREMRATRERLMQLSRVVFEIYGPASRSAFAFQRLNEAMERLCVELGTQAITDCPGRQTDEFYR